MSNWCFFYILRSYSFIFLDDFESTSMSIETVATTRRLAKWLRQALNRVHDSIQCCCIVLLCYYQFYNHYRLSTNSIFLRIDLDNLGIYYYHKRHSYICFINSHLISGYRFRVHRTLTRNLNFKKSENL